MHGDFGRLGGVLLSAGNFFYRGIGPLGQLASPIGQPAMPPPMQSAVTAPLGGSLRVRVVEPMTGDARAVIVRPER
jgi:hypothetical protein